MLYPLTFVVPAAMFHKHRMGNILSIRNLDCRFPPATLHSARARSHSPSPSAEALSFPLPCPLIHLNISQSAPFIRCVMYNLRQQQCQQGSVFSPTLLVLNRLRCYCFVSKKKKKKTYLLEIETVPGVQFGPSSSTIESAMLISS